MDKQTYQKAGVTHKTLNSGKWYSMKGTADEREN